MKEFYKKLTETLRSAEATALLNTVAIKKIGTIDLYKSQYLVQEAFEVLVLPAVLVEYDINHETKIATISLHCCWEQIRNTGGVVQQQDSAFLFFDFVDLVHTLTKGIESEHTGKLTLTNEQPSKNDAVIYVTILTYTASYSGKIEAPADKYTYTEEEADLSTTSGIVENIIEIPNEKTYKFD